MNLGKEHASILTMSPDYRAPNSPLQMPFQHAHRECTQVCGALLGPWFCREVRKRSSRDAVALGN